MYEILSVYKMRAVYACPMHVGYNPNIARLVLFPQICTLQARVLSRRNSHLSRRQLGRCFARTLHFRKRQSSRGLDEGRARSRVRTHRAVFDKRTFLYALRGYPLNDMVQLKEIASKAYER